MLVKEIMRDIHSLFTRSDARWSVDNIYFVSQHFGSRHRRHKLGHT